jgi:hypothetical protein
VLTPALAASACAAVHATVDIDLGSGRVCLAG